MNTKKSEKVKAKGSTKRKVFFMGLGVLAAGVLSYFGINYFKQRKSTGGEQNVVPDPATTKTKDTVKPASKTATRTTASAKPKAPKAGTKKTNAPIKTSVKTNSAPQPLKPKPILANILALGLHSAIIKKDFASVREYLKGIKSVADYTAVNNVFKNSPTGGLRKTVVEALLSSFTDEKQKQELRKAFISIGLKYNGKKWSLSGTEEKPLLITREETTVWKNPKESVSVPVNMVLGKEIAKRGTFTLFENERQFFLVESKSVNYYKPN